MNNSVAEQMTTQKVAGILGVTAKTLWRWRQEGTGPPARRTGIRSVRYDGAEFAEWLKNRDAA